MPAKPQAAHPLWQPAAGWPSPLLLLLLLLLRLPRQRNEALKPRHAEAERDAVVGQAAGAQLGSPALPQRR